MSEEGMSVEILVTVAVLEQIPLHDVLRLCQTSKGSYQRYAAHLTYILGRVNQENPALVLRLLRHIAVTTVAIVDECFLETCIRRLQWRKTISVRRSNALALLDDGSVVGCCKQGIFDKIPKGRYVSVHAGDSRGVGLGLLDNGEAVVWGRAVYAAPPTLPSGRRYVSISGHSLHLVALLDTGEVVQWLPNRYGTLEAKKVIGEHRCVAVESDGSFSLALLEDGQVIGWGDNHQGQARGSVGALPRRRYVAMSGCYLFSVGLLDNGEMALWGNHDLVASGMRVNEEVWRRGRRFVIVRAGGTHGLGLLDNGEVVGWGNDKCQQISGAGAALAASGARRYLAIAARNEVSMGLVDNGRIVFWGSNTYIEERMVDPPPGRRFVW